jgi:hypothetical protein
MPEYSTDSVLVSKGIRWKNTTVAFSSQLIAIGTSQLEAVSTFACLERFSFTIAGFNLQT